MTCCVGSRHCPGKPSRPPRGRRRWGDEMEKLWRSDEDHGAPRPDQPGISGRVCRPLACPMRWSTTVRAGCRRAHGHDAWPAVALLGGPGPGAFRAGYAGPIPVARSFVPVTGVFRLTVHLLATPSIGASARRCCRSGTWGESRPPMSADLHRQAGCSHSMGSWCRGRRCHSRRTGRWYRT